MYLTTVCFLPPWIKLLLKQICIIYGNFFFFPRPLVLSLSMRPCVGSYSCYIIDFIIYLNVGTAGTYIWQLLLQPSYSLQVYPGHTSHVVSLDFHPKKNDLFCSCDDNNEIRFWNINPYACTRVFKVTFENFLNFLN